MSLYQLLGLALLAAALGALLRALGSRISPFLSALAALALLIFALSRYSEPLSLLSELASVGGIGELLDPLLRMLGIGFVTAFTADTCRDLGEGTVAARVELCGQVEIFLLCLPYLSELLSLAVEVGS